MVGGRGIFVGLGGAIGIIARDDADWQFVEFGV
jgi:hypothetical protein